MLGSILVTGATGRQGGAVARRLLESGFQVRALSRHPDSAACRDLAARGATIRAGDFDDPSSLAHALDGTLGVFAMQTPYETDTEREEIHGRRLAEAAVQAGVQQFVYSSVASADRPTGVAHFESKGRIERYISALNFRYVTVLRPTFFMEMLLSPGNLRTLARGRIELTLNRETRVAMIAVDDIARMAVSAFRDPERLNGKAITLAGDNPSFAEVAAAFSAVLPWAIIYVQVDADAIAPDTRPKLGTQRWLEAEGWSVDITRLRSSLPFEARTIRNWALENAAALASS